MNIAIFTDLFLEVPGGIPSSISAQRDALKKAENSVTIFCPGFKTKDPDVKLLPTCKHFRINGAPLSRRPEIIERWIEQNVPNFKDFDLIHVHYEAGASLAGTRLAKKHDIPLIQTMHGREDMAIAINVPFGLKTLAATLLNHWHKRYLPHEKTVKKDHYMAPTYARAKMWELMVAQANAADHVLTPSKHFATKLKRYGAKRPLTPVSNGVPDSLADRPWAIRNWQSGPLKLLWNSRASREKRILPFLKSLKIAKNHNFHITIYGGGNQLKKAQRYVKRHGLSSKVTFKGSVPHAKIMQDIKNFHLSVTVSYGFDTQGLTLLEAEVTGLPVFYCDPDMAEFVPKNGSIKSGPSPEDMAKSLMSIKTGDISAMSAEMLKHQKDYLQSTQIKNLLKVYQELA